jgi:hypothetical protein
MITERAMLAAVHISIWTTVKPDRKIIRVPAGRLWAMVLSVCGSFFEGLHDRRILLGMMRTRSQFAPLMTMQKTVDVVD